MLHISRFTLSVFVTTGLLQLGSPPAGAASGLATSFGDMFNTAADGDMSALRKMVANGANVNDKDPSGITPLMYAAEFGRTAAVRFLLARGAQVNARANGGITALMFTILRTRATGKFHGQVIRLLLAKGADVNARDRDGNTALLLLLDSPLVQSCIPEPVTPDTSAVQIVRLLLAKRANMNVRNRQGQTALKIATTPREVVLQTGTSRVADRDFDAIAQLLKQAGAKE